MSHMFDPDEYETVITTWPCSCGGNLLAGTCVSPSMCNGGGSCGQRRRSDEEIYRIRVEKRLKREDMILAEADSIRKRRAEAKTPEGASA